jgi:hypothetical protein
MAQHRSHSIEFKRHVARSSLAGRCCMDMHSFMISPSPAAASGSGHLSRALLI